MVGVGLLVLTLLLSFTGYLLPWDQLAYWAVTVGTNMASSTPLIWSYRPVPRVDRRRSTTTSASRLLGGTIVGQNALLRFYVLHCMALPVVFGILAAIHFWRIRKDGGISRPQSDAPAELPVSEVSVPVGAVADPPSPPERGYRLLAYVPGKTLSGKRDLAVGETPVWPHLVLREFLWALAVIIFIWVLAVAVNAPLEEKANPTATPNPAKAPWYFVGLQELLAYFDPWIAGVAIPGIAVLGLAAIPYLDVNLGGHRRV